jgi:hypothetical protein
MPNAGARVLAADTARHYVYVYATATQTITTGGSITPVNFAAEIVDTDTMHDNVTNPSRLTIGAAALGYWEVSGIVAYSGSPASSGPSEAVRACLLLNGAEPVNRQGTQVMIPVFTGTTASISAGLPPVIVQVTASTDYVELGAFHNNAASRTTLVSGGVRSQFCAVWLGS